MVVVTEGDGIRAKSRIGVSSFGVKSLAIL